MKVDKRRKKVKGLGKGGAVMPEEAQAQMGGARLCCAAWDGHARKLKKIFWAKKWHSH